MKTLWLSQKQKCQGFSYEMVSTDWFYTISLHIFFYRCLRGPFLVKKEADQIAVQPDPDKGMSPGCRNNWQCVSNKIRASFSYANNAIFASIQIDFIFSETKKIRNYSQFRHIGLKNTKVTRVNHTSIFCLQVHRRHIGKSRWSVFPTTFHVINFRPKYKPFLDSEDPKDTPMYQD